MDNGKPETLEHHGAELSFKERMSYGDYLKLDKVLDAQAPLSDAHDELLFIIQHQTSELWMKLAIHELTAAKDKVAEDSLPEAFKMLTRVARIFEQLNSAWEVLRTMTPSDYTRFRDALGQSSGFQSYQYRAIEYLAGNRNKALLKPHEHVPHVHDALELLLSQPSLYDEAIRALSRNGFSISDAVLNRDVSQPYLADESVTQAWLQVYREPERYWYLYDLAEKLVDFEDYFRRWRFNHVTTVERVIGLKRGTGGTAGVSYLRKMLDTVLFPELWQMRVDL
ncbi:tryptophan 2,3-dioxygenase [Rhodobacteraceae bacterium RKSG542]|uniref:tryptophan 2,3-dioxygenase n=1 Tax=Pseudovibrio flavus TaxID=2529854 RepID=UPI0012BC1038|nr:tryptophan 2,3-dioxygenase [Pseudovibrio flavus]MTI17261.1 tryptophan 2,3-dioxygenase [Pseudovibrio flavus]